MEIEGLLFISQVHDYVFSCFMLLYLKVCSIEPGKYFPCTLFSDNGDCLLFQISSTTFMGFPLLLSCRFIKLNSCRVTWLSSSCQEFRPWCPSYSGMHGGFKLWVESVMALMKNVLNINSNVFLFVF